MPNEVIVVHTSAYASASVRSFQEIAVYYMRVFIGVSCLLVLSACGESTPTAPTPPPTPPLLSGQYVGTYTVTNCSESSALGGTTFCANLSRTGTHIYTPTQSGSTLAGTLGIGTFTMPVTGNIGTDGLISLSGSAPVVQGATLTVNTWRGQLSGTTITGTMTFTATVAQPLSQGVVQATFSLAR